MSRSIAGRLIDQARTKSEQHRIKGLGGIDPYMAAAAGLAHDLGHPPFGHAGEEQLDSLTANESLGLHTDGGFEGNAQTFRIAVKMEASHNVYHGLRLTAGTRAGILKYPWLRDRNHPLRRRKFGYYLADTEEFLESREWLENTEIGREGQSLEASIMDLADDVTYAVHDFEDFLVLGVMRSSSILFHCGEFINTRKGQKSARENPLDSLHDRLAKDFGDRYKPDLLVEACAALLATEIPTPETPPYQLRNWRNGLLETLLDGVRLAEEPKGDTGAWVISNDRTWHYIELLKFFSKKYVVERSDTVLLQRAGNSLLKGCLIGLQEWVNEAKEAGKMELLPTHLRWVVDWTKRLGGDPQRALLDYLCMLSDSETAELFSLLSGRKIPHFLRPSF